MPRRLSLRIALLIAVIVPLQFLFFINLNFAAVRLLHVPDSPFANAVQVALAIISTPLLVGLLASRYVSRPLRDFVSAVEGLVNDRSYQPLPPAGISEFDQVYEAINRLGARLGDEESLRKTLISDASHELGTPLTAMLSQIAAMQDGILPVTPERLDGMRLQVERLIALVAQLDAYTRARLPRHPAQVESLVLSELCERLRRSMEPLPLELRIEVPRDLEVRAEQAPLEQILRNLVENAVQHSGGTRVTISADAGRIVVCDDGSGVAPAALGRIFERFYRADRSRDRRTGGLGLGLAIVQELVTRQGWSVVAENAGPGLRIVIDTSSELR